MNQINLKMHTNEQIIAKLCGKFKHECLRRWLWKELATDTWKVCHGKHSYFLINACMMDSGGLESVWWENWMGALIYFIIHTIQHSMGFWPTIGLSFISYKIKSPSSDLLYVEITLFVVWAQVIFHKLSDLLTQLTRFWWFYYKVTVYCFCSYSYINNWHKGTNDISKFTSEQILITVLYKHSYNSI